MGRTCVKHYPGESNVLVAPQNGSVVSCGIYGVFEHTGIWVDGNVIELRGNGLIRGISPSRFLEERSGNTISVLCNPSFSPLVDDSASLRATDRLFEFSEYDVITNNCHKFVWQCVSGQRSPITSFYDLNQAFYQHFDSQLSWCPIIHDQKDKYSI